MTIWQRLFGLPDPPVRDESSGVELPPAMDTEAWERERRQLESVKHKIERARQQLGEVLEARRRHGQP